ncbi:MAG: hypothetical protein BAA01_13515 [Bacillus thermozeamaize]|uniref:2-hydroxycyclohexanecarboxyl-CoA dehydrogenase n=1 Tax=Bacillus thermozeamaize TaxID=230954 RepID=A0A1Y3PDJ7_9BACI|nr:MAG: hypothetical protein BAA01_13515 [Bacillus thermozeamaize]
MKPRVVLITGAGSGIGRTTAMRFASNGDRVVVNDIDEQKANDVVKEIKTFGLEAMAAPADITRLDEVENMTKEVVERWGRIDVLVNNAGVGDIRLFLETEPEDWHREIQVNIYGVLNVCKAVLPHMVRQNSGVVVNIASDAARVGETYMAVYSMAKAGVVGFSKALAKEMARYGIRVNVVCPGATRTPLVKALLEQKGKEILKNYPIRRFAEPEDIANGIFFLASPEADYITGQTLSINGGYTMI